MKYTFNDKFSKLTNTKSMKKLFGLTTALFCLVFLLFSFVLTTAHAEESCEVVLDIEGETFSEKIEIATNKRLRVGNSFHDFIEKMLDLGYEGEDVLNYISPNLGTAYFNLLGSKEIQPVNAELKVDFSNWKFDYISGKNGKLFDKCEACLLLGKAMDGKMGSLRLKESEPEETVKKLEERTVLMGKFTTSLETSKPERKENIALASSFIHGKILKAGEEFSFNEIVGERTEERGFKNAKVIQDGKYIDGVGGGVCQLATTLYNAVLLSGLKVKSVSRHTFAPSYVPPSRDAMVSSFTDFRFENDTDCDIYIFAKVSSDSVTVGIYGLKRHNVTLESVKTEILPFSNVDQEGNLLDDLTNKTLISAGFEGFKSELYVIKDGEKTKVRSDVYKSKDAVYE